MRFKVSQLYLARIIGDHIPTTRSEERHLCMIIQETIHDLVRNTLLGLGLHDY